MGFFSAKRARYEEVETKQQLIRLSEYHTISSQFRFHRVCSERSFESRKRGRQDILYPFIPCACRPIVS